MFKGTIKDLRNNWSEVKSIVPPEPIWEFIRSTCRSPLMHKEISNWMFIYCGNPAPIRYLYWLWSYIPQVSINRLKIYINILRRQHWTNRNTLRFFSCDPLGGVPQPLRALRVFLIFTVHGHHLIHADKRINLLLPYLVLNRTTIARDLVSESTKVLD